MAYESMTVDCEELKHFIIDRGVLERVFLIIGKRLEAAAQSNDKAYSTQSIRIARANNTSITSDDLGSIFEEENSSDRKVQSAHIMAAVHNSFGMKLDIYLNYSSIEASVYGENHDVVRAIADDLNSIIRSASPSSIFYKKNVREFLPNAISAIPQILFIAYFAPLINDSLTSMEVAEPAIWALLFVASISILIGIILTVLCRGFIAKYYPRSLLLVGKEIERYNDIKSKRIYIWSSLGTALILPILAAAVIKYLQFN